MEQAAEKLRIFGNVLGGQPELASAVRELSRPTDRCGLESEATQCFAVIAVEP